MDSINDILNTVFSFYQQLNLSVTGILAIAAVFFIAFLIAVREMVSWFFKIDDVKRDIKKVHEATVHLEAEIKSLQNLLLQARSRVKLVDSTTDNQLPEIGSPNNISVENPQTPAQEKEKATRFGGFPIVH